MTHRQSSHRSLPISSCMCHVYRIVRRGLLEYVWIAQNTSGGMWPLRSPVCQTTLAALTNRWMGRPDYYLLRLTSCHIWLMWELLVHAWKEHTRPYAL